MFDWSGKNKIHQGKVREFWYLVWVATLQWKMTNLWHGDRNFVILHLLKINVKIKSAVARIWIERDINHVWRNRGILTHQGFCVYKTWLTVIRLCVFYHRIVRYTISRFNVWMTNQVERIYVFHYARMNNKTCIKLSWICLKSWSVIGRIESLRVQSDWAFKIQKINTICDRASSGKGGWNRRESCEQIVSCDTPLTRRNFFIRLTPIPPDCLRLVSHDTIVALTRHDWNCIWSNRKQSWAKIVSSESTFTFVLIVIIMNFLDL